MNALNLTKTIAVGIASAGVGTVVTNVVKATTPEDTKIVKSISILIGSFVISSMVSDRASDYLNEKIDNTVNAVKKTFAKNEEPVEEAE